MIINGRELFNTYYPMKKCGKAVKIHPIPIVMQPIPIIFGLCSLDPK